MDKEVSVKILKGRLLLDTGNTIIEVRPFAKTHLVKYMGYYDKDRAMESNDPYVYIYRGKLKRTDIRIPGSIYKTATGAIIWTEHDPEVKEKYHLSNCKELSKDLIAKQLADPKVEINELTPELLEINDGEIFAPQIRDTDDILKRVIKTTLQNMRINIKTLKSKFSNDYDLNNLKSQLIKPGAMSSKYFNRWAEILDVDIEVIVTNKPGSNKLKDEVTIIMK